MSESGKSLDYLFGAAETGVAKELIKAFNDRSAKAVKKTLADHTEIWKQKSEPEQNTLGQQALIWASHHDGHRVQCPACASAAIVTGSPAGVPIRTIDENTITEKQHYLPQQFECIACGLKISGLSRLTAAGLGDGYTATSTFDAAELGAPEFEDDFNEY